MDTVEWKPITFNLIQKIGIEPLWKVGLYAWVCGYKLFHIEKIQCCDFKLYIFISALKSVQYAGVAWNDVFHPDITET